MLGRKREAEKFFLRIVLPVVLLNCSACGTAQILGLPPKKAAELLRNGDTGFISRSIELSSMESTNFVPAVSTLTELNRIDPAASFCAGLLIGAAQANTRGEENNNRILSILLFCAALESPSLPAGREAARQLTAIVLKGPDDSSDEGALLNSPAGILHYLDSGTLKEKNHDHLAILRAACLYRMGRYDEAGDLLSGWFPAAPASAPAAAAPYDEEWKIALSLLSGWKIHGAHAGEAERTKLDLIAFIAETPQDEIRNWALKEALSIEGLKDCLEMEALSARLYPGNYPKALSLLRSALLDGGIFFFRFPEMLASLGRAYQYTPAFRAEGAELFKSWELLLGNSLQSFGENFALPSSLVPEDGKDTEDNYRELRAFISSLDTETRNAIRYRLLFYSGRIERTRERYAESSVFFRRALSFAPDALQADASIWYALSNALAASPSAAAALFLETMPQWNDLSYFSDVLDRLSCYLTGKRQWRDIHNIFLALERRISGSAHHSGASLAQYAWILGRVVQEGYYTADRSSESFFRLAFDEGNWSFYYRAMAASKLGTTLAPGEESSKTTGVLPQADNEGEFIMGFFNTGAASFALPYIRAAEESMDLKQLRRIAQALASSGRQKESLDLISRYTGREDYNIAAEDLELFYPRPFLDLMEKYAAEAELGAEILYGLVRTESYFMPEIVSRSGAIGLSQLMIPTALDMADRMARQGGSDYRDLDSDSLKEAEQNIHIGSYYLKYLTEQMGNPMLALLAYNGGMGRMRRWLAADKQQKDGGLPLDLFLETIEFNETREYGRRVLAAAAVYGYLYYGMSMEAVAEDIYGKTSAASP